MSVTFYNQDTARVMISGSVWDIKTLIWSVLFFFDKPFIFKCIKSKPPFNLSLIMPKFINWYYMNQTVWVQIIMSYKIIQVLQFFRVGLLFGLQKRCSSVSKSHRSKNRWGRGSLQRGFLMSTCTVKWSWQTQLNLMSPYKELQFCVFDMRFFWQCGALQGCGVLWAQSQNNLYFLMNYFFVAHAILSNHSCFTTAMWVLNWIQGCTPVVFVIAIFLQLSECG